MSDNRKNAARTLEGSLGGPALACAQTHLSVELLTVRIQVVSISNASMTITPAIRQEIACYCGHKFDLQSQPGEESKEG